MITPKPVLNLHHVVEGLREFRGLRGLRGVRLRRAGGKYCGAVYMRTGPQVNGSRDDPMVALRHDDWGIFGRVGGSLPTLSECIHSDLFLRIACRL